MFDEEFWITFSQRNTEKQAAQNARERELAAPANQSSDLNVDGSSTVERGNLSNGNGPAEIISESFDQDKAIDIIIGSYFQNPSTQERNDIASAAYEQLASMEQFLKGSRRILTPEAKIYFISDTIAKKAGVPPPQTAEEAVAAYQQTVALLGSRLGLEGRPTEEIAEISSRLREYELETVMFDDPQLTEEGRINFVARIAAKIDARKAAAAQLPTASTATVTHLVSSAPVQAAESTQKVAVKAAAISLSAPVKKAAAAVLPPPPPQESAFDKQKKENLRDLKEQIATARRERATHQATKDRLEPELQRQLQQQAQQQKQNVRDWQQKIDDFKAANLFSSRIPGTDEYNRLQVARDKRDAAASATTQSVNETRVALDATTKSIETLSSRIQSLEQQHAQVTASIDPAIERQRQQEAAAARAIALEQQRQQQAVEAQLAAERARVLAKQQAATQQQPSVKAAAVSHPAPLKAAAVLPPPPSQESPLERQKKVQLQNLRDKIEAAKLKLAKKEATRNTLQQELEQHLQRQPEEKAQILARLQKPIDDFKAANFFSSRISGTDEHYQLQGLRDKRDAAALAETPSVVRTRAALETAKNSIEILTSTIKSLKQEHATVLHELEVCKRDRLTREVDEAAAIARAEALTWEKIGSIAIVKRSSLGSTSSEGNDSQPSTPPGKQRSSSDGSSSGNESNQSTPEKQPLLTPTFTTATMAEVEHLQSEIARTHEFIGKARELLKEEKKYNFLPKLMEVWSQYFDLAEQRSWLKQNLATLMGHIPEPVFRRPDNVAELVSQYRDAIYYETDLGLSSDSFSTDLLKDLYKEHAVYDMKQYAQHPTIRELEQPLIESLQRRYQRAVERLLNIELSLVAPEERPLVDEELKGCTWQKMPGFSTDRRESAMTKACLEARSSGYYSASSSSSDWWKPEGQQQLIQRNIQRNYNFIRQQQVQQWNIQQNYNVQNAVANGTLYFPVYK